ncbi:hypothetical protein LDENG_00050280 [Lucifuga dentata]|nr:hypothetical protein LDENG_00050280 [Lucifuga dentata]
MEDSNSSKPFMVTSSLNFKVTTPSFYNQPKKFASVAPPRPKMADDLPLPAPPEESACLPTCPSPPPPPPPPPPTASATTIPSAAGNSQRLMEKQTSLDKQIDSLTDLLSEMETRGPFNPKLPSQYSSAPAPKPSMGDRPPPAPWAEELKARTNRQTNHNSAPAAAPTPAAQPFVKPPAVAPKSGFGGRPITSATSLAQKLNQNLNHTPTPFGGTTKSAASNFPPPPAAPPAPPAPPNITATPPASNHKKSTPFGSQENANLPPPAAVPPPQSKTMVPPPSSFNQPMKTPPASMPSPPGPVTVPGGGIPLSMREVEELERMTQDFIKDMDTHAPVVTSPPTEVCGKCGEALSRTQPAVRAMDKLFHSNCFCCMTCHRPLQGMQFYDRDGSPQCEDCYTNSLAMCSRCGERITDRVLKAVGQCFHAHCFRCSTCSCTLEGAPFITDDNNNPYCVQDYHRRFSPLCVSCNEPIIPAPGSEETVRVVALEKNFHLKCYRCEDCARPLSIEADEDGCYPLDGKILCMKCHTQRAKRAQH